MIAALLAAALPVVLGVVLSTVPGAMPRSQLGPLRTFALLAALSVVLLELLPEAAAQIGALALVLFGVGLVVPRLAERLVRGRAGEHSLAGEELAFAVLGIHQLVDGVEVGLAWRLTDGAWAITLAVAAHSIPLIAAVLLELGRHGGRRLALLHGAALTAVTGIGGLLGASGTEVLPGSETWLPALLAGFLVHVLWHHLREAAPGTGRGRWAELVAGGVGFALPALLLDVGGGHSHSTEGHGATAEFLESLGHLFVETAPMLLLGLALGALLQVFGGRIPARWLTAPTAWGQALRGAVVGAPLPLCACSVLPIADALHRRKAGAALVVAFLLSAPELGVETFTLSVRFLGWDFAVLRLVGSVLAAALAALALARVVGPVRDEEVADLEVATEGSALQRFRSAFDQSVVQIGPLVVAGLVLAALFDAFVTTEQVTAVAASGFDVPLVTVLSVPTYVCASSATPLAGVLWGKGLSAGAVLTGLLLGPATNVATLAFLRKAFGGRAMLWGVGTFVAVTWGLAVVANLLLPGGPPESVLGEGEGAHGFGLLPWVLVGLLLRSAWQVGPRAWLAEITADGGQDDGHEHEHGHGHGHEEEHGHPSRVGAGAAGLSSFEQAPASLISLAPGAAPSSPLSSCGSPDAGCCGPGVQVLDPRGEPPKSDR